jgi:putative DNA primase/helicase
MTEDDIDKELRRQGLPLDAGVAQEERRIARRRELKKSVDAQMKRLNAKFSVSLDGQNKCIPCEHWDSYEKAIDTGCFDKNGVNHLFCVRYIMQKIRVKNIRRTTKNGVQFTMYYYSDMDGAYHPGAEQIIKTSVDNLLGELTSTYHKREIVDMIGNSTVVDSSVVQDAPPFQDWVLLKNGRLNVFTREFRPGFTPDEVYLHPLPITYDPKATCPEIDKFIEQVVDPEDRAMLYEIPAYGLMPGYRFHKVPLLYSPGRSGRSTYMTMLTDFIGKENVAHVNIHSLCNERFSAATLYGARLNMAGEISIRDINDTGRFKAAVGEDELYAEHKCQPPFSFKNEAKFLFAANVLPQFRDESDGLWARIIPVEFIHNFEREGTMIENFASRLTTESELSGLLNKALDALQDMVKNHGFSKRPGIDEVRDWWYSKTDSVSMFTSETSGYLIFTERNDLDTLTTVPKDSVREAYEEFCRTRRITPVSQRDFNKRMKDILEELVGFKTEMQPTPEQSKAHHIGRYGKGKRPVCYRGLDFTEEYKERLFQNKAVPKPESDDPLVSRDEGSLETSPEQLAKPIIHDYM